MTFQAPPQSITTEAAILDIADEFVALRRKLHSEPELAYQEKKTAALVAERLRSWGYEVAENIGGTGVVGTLRNGLGEKSIGIVRR